MWYLNLQQPAPLYQYTHFKNGKIKFPKKSIKWSTLPLRFTNQYFEGEYCPLKYVAFEPGSRQKIELWMRKYYNWEPTIFTASGSPKINADTLAEMNISDADDLKRYLKIVKDLGQLSEGDNSLLKLLPSDNRFKVNVDTLGTNTGRMSHCVSTDYLIKTPSGYKHHSDLVVGDWIYTYDIEHKQEVLSKLKAINLYNTITGRMSNGTSSFICTLNHKWLTVDGLKYAKDITPTDTLIL